MNTASGPATTISSDVSRVAQDFLVSGLGALTSVLTAAILAAIDLKFDFSIYSWMVWFVIPVGAICCGLVASSGYYLGARLFNHRPTRILLFNMVGISISTFFLIHYLNYYLMRVDGTAVRDLLPFSQFLDLELSHTAMQFSIRAHPVGTPVELGSWGYLYAVLQMLGFAIGGVFVYFNLKSLAYCDTCSRYLVKKGIQTRYTADSDTLTKAVTEIMQCFSERRFQDAISAHAKAAGYENSTGMTLRSRVEVKRCKDCNQHWLKFTVSKKAKKDEWEDIGQLGYEAFCVEPITTEPVASVATSGL
jgi:hypothetical protein